MLTLSHKKLEVYLISFNILKTIYKVTENYPKKELYGLVSQINRCAVSICANIAEGASRISKLEKKRFYEIARSSLVELDTHLEISNCLGFYLAGSNEQMEKDLESVFRILSKMIRNLM